MRAVLPLVLVLAACGPGRYWERQPVRGPDGSNQWYSIRCGVRVDCLHLIGETCDYGYDIQQDTGKARHTVMLVHCHPRPQSARRTPSPATAAPASTPAPPTTSGGLGAREFPE